MLVKISDIKIGDRFRKDLGDITELAKSIERQGLLHPIVISENKELLCGKRRIQAYIKLNLSEIEANIFSFPNGQVQAISSTEANYASREIEADENIVRKNFTNAEIAEIYEFYRESEETSSRKRMLAGKKLEQPSGNFPKGRTREKIAIHVGVSDRQLEKICAIKQAVKQFRQLENIWNKVGCGKMKVDKGYNQVKRFQRIKEAEKLAANLLGNNNWKSNSNFDLRFGDMRELGKIIPKGSINLIFTDPPYSEEFVPLYGNLAKLAHTTLPPGGSLITFVGHHNIFKVNDLIESNSDLIYHWQIIVRHSGSKGRVFPYKVWPRYKPLLWYYKPSSSENGSGSPTMYKDIADLIESQAVSKENHEWEQSTIEAKHVIEPLTVKGNVILDPFMGSGTTGEAALELGRKFIGIEIEERAFHNATLRLNQIAKLPHEMASKKLL